MLYDLNLTWTPSTPAEALDQTLRQAAILGYDVVALNHTISKLPIPSPITNPIPILPTTTTTSSSSSSGRRRQLPTVLRRATVAIADPRENHRLDAVAAAYDVLAVRPTTEAAFTHACVSLSEPSLISLDLAANLGYHFRPKPVMAAVRRGLRFEVCYAQALAAAASDRARALFVANLVGLVRATKGRGLVVSSGAPASAASLSLLLLRAPADVVNLLAVWGLGTERGLDAVSATPRSVVVNEGIKRSSFRGVVDIVQAPGAAPAAVPERQKKKQQQHQQSYQKQQKPDADATTQGEDEGGKKKKGGRANDGQGGDPNVAVSEEQRLPQKQAGTDPLQSQGVKRKNGEQAGAGEAAEDEPPQKLSKRQAKKQRRAAAQQSQAADNP